jgi:hypothetical protein
MIPSWLLVASSPFAVARDSPASSAVTTQLIGSNTVITNTPVPADAAASHGERLLSDAKS